MEAVRSSQCRRRGGRPAGARPGRRRRPGPRRWRRATAPASPPARRAGDGRPAPPGWTHSRPWSARGRPGEDGRRRPQGMDGGCTRRGRSRAGSAPPTGSRRRPRPPPPAPPPSSPARARVTAAASPLGPAPTTTASVTGGRRRRPCSRPAPTQGGAGGSRRVGRAAGGRRVAGAGTAGAATRGAPLMRRHEDPLPTLAAVGAGVSSPSWSPPAAEAATTTPVDRRHHRRRQPDDRRATTPSARRATTPGSDAVGTGACKYVTTAQASALAASPVKPGVTPQPAHRPGHVRLLRLHLRSRQLARRDRRRRRPPGQRARLFAQFRRSSRRERLPGRGRRRRRGLLRGRRTSTCARATPASSCSWAGPPASPGASTRFPTRRRWRR